MAAPIRRGWFADVDPDQHGNYRYQPCLETGEGHIPCFEMWFDTEQECLDWISETVIGVGLLDLEDH